MGTLLKWFIILTLCFVVLGGLYEGIVWIVDTSETRYITKKINAGDYERAYSKLPSTADGDFWDRFTPIFKAECMDIIPLKEDQYNERVVWQLSSLTPVGVKPEPNRKMEYDSWSPSVEYKNARKYVNFVAHYNQLVDEVVRLSITYSNKNMANRIVLLYLQDVTITVQDSSSPYYWSASYSWRSRDNAKKAISTAVANKQF